MTANQFTASNKPRSRISTSGSPGRDGICVFSRICDKVVQAVQTLKSACFLSRIGQIDACSTTTSTRNPHRSRNACTWPSVVVLPAFGTPANSITTGFLAVPNRAAAALARCCRADIVESRSIVSGKPEPLSAVVARR